MRAALRTVEVDLCAVVVAVVVRLPSDELAIVHIAVELPIDRTELRLQVEAG